MSRLWTPDNRIHHYMAPFGALVGACRPKMQQAAAPSSLLTSLVAYWKLEEASGTRVDATGRGNDLTDNNTVGQAAGKVGSAASLVAANLEWLSILDNADVSTGAGVSFTIAAWVQIASTPADFMRLMYKGLGSWPWTHEYEIRWRTSGSRFLFSKLTGSGGEVTALWSAAAAINTWYHILAWYDLSVPVIGISVDNGVAVTTAFGDGPQDTAADLLIGSWPGAAAQYWNGLIDEVGIWKRVLTAAEGTALYNGGNGITYPFVGT